MNKRYGSNQVISFSLTHQKSSSKYDIKIHIILGKRFHLRPKSSEFSSKTFSRTNWLTYRFKVLK